MEQTLYPIEWTSLRLEFNDEYIKKKKEKREKGNIIYEKKLELKLKLEKLKLEKLKLEKLKLELENDNSYKRKGSESISINIKEHNNIFKNKEIVSIFKNKNNENNDKKQNKNCIIL